MINVIGTFINMYTNVSRIIRTAFKKRLFNIGTLSWTKYSNNSN